MPKTNRTTFRHDEKTTNLLNELLDELRFLYNQKMSRSEAINYAIRHTHRSLAYINARKLRMGK